MSLMPGVHTNRKKDGTIYYRSSITYKNKHISLGSYDNESGANKAYLEAKSILFESCYNLDDYNDDFHLSFDKWVVLHNYRDNNLYIKNPIYLKSNYFIYYLDRNTDLKFNVDDLFYYSTHKIMRRNGYLFVNDYGMQINILSRYGIKNFAVEGKDYVFINGDKYDYRYDNLNIINKYYGVAKETYKKSEVYTTRILINGTYIVGRYLSEIEAAIAYNKAVDIVTANGCNKDFYTNYIYNLDEIEYASIYHRTKISYKIKKLQF